MAWQGSHVLRLALSSTLPIILVLYAVCHGGPHAEQPTTLYAVWSSAYNGGAGGYQAGYGQQQVQQASGVYSTNPYYNAVNTAELSANVNPYDAAALQYSSGSAPQNQMKTLHALASAKRLYHQMRAPSGSYDNAVKQDNPAAALQSLQGKVVQGSDESKQIAKASLAIQQVLEQSKADHKLAKDAARSAHTTTENGNSWNSLLSRESGPRAMAMASDWLSTAVATTSGSKGKKKTLYARAQLEAALSQVDGRYSHNAEAGAWSNQKRERNSEIRAMSNLAHAVMYKALSGTSGGPSSAAVAPLSLTSFNPPGISSPASAWTSNSAGAGFSGVEGVGSARGGGGGGGKAAMSGAAPGLSSYDAQILANGPPGE